MTFTRALTFSTLTLVVFSCSLCHAAKPGGGGTVTNNVAVSLDEVNGVLTLSGNGANNLLYVSISATGINISALPWGQTTINGSSDDFALYFYPMTEVVLNIDLAGGNDRLWVNVQDNTSPYQVSTFIAGGDGADEVAVFSAIEQNVGLNGFLWINGGKGDDDISLTNIDTQSSLDVGGGDGNDLVSLEDVFATGSVVLSGGRGRDTLSQLYFTPFWGADIAGFETLLGP